MVIFNNVEGGIMELSNRLKAISDFVEDNAVIADVGTDHGYIPIYLAKEGRIKHALACDVNKGPLDKARMNIKHYDVEDYVETRLSDGLDKLEKNEVDTLIIAGMGGLLIEKIMEKGKEVLVTINQLILSPHSDIDIVRKQLHTLGYRIRDEKLIQDEGKYYHIMDAVRGEDKKYDTIHYKYGKILIETRSPLLKEILQNKARKYQEVIEELAIQNTERSLERRKVIQEELEEIGKVLTCL